MVLEFEGAIDNINEAQVAFIGNVLEKRGYQDTKVTIESVGKAGDNYLANVKRIIAKNEYGEFRMIAKIAPQMEAIRVATETDTIFRNEHILYTLVLPKYQELEEQADLLKSDRLRFAECYGSLCEPRNEVILLEDLQVAGFGMCDRFTPLSDECIRSVLRNFAILHSLSFALKYKEPETFNEYKRNLIDTTTDLEDRPDVLLFFSHLENKVVTFVEGDVRKRHLNKCISYGMSQYRKMKKEVIGSKHSVIHQGDSWTSNILFKFDGDLLEQSVLIDYQLSKESNPIHDLMFMIFGCSDHETRLEHYKDWIDYYHSELDQRLHNYGLKANYVYPKEQLDADLKRYAKAMLGTLVISSTISLMQPANAEMIKDSMERYDEPVDEELKQTIMKEFLTFDDKYMQILKKRLEGIVDSFVKFGLL